MATDIELQAATLVPPVRSEGPWRVAFEKLAADRAAMAGLLLLILIVLCAAAAPWYASSIANTDPFRANVTGEIVIDGETHAVVEASTEGLGLGQTPIGPTWRSQYLLGADEQGRDVAARLLYGGRSSLIVSIGATIFCIAVGALFGIIAGFLVV